MALQKKFAALIAAPVAVAAMAGTAAFTADADSVTLGGATAENVDYLIPATGTTGATTATYTNAAGDAVTTKYGHTPEWFQIASGSDARPSGIQEAGDILYIDTFSNDSTDDGNIISGLNIVGQMVNLPDINASYATCALPLKVYNSADDGTTWTEVTDDVLDVSAGDPYYIDCKTGRFDITLRGDAELDEQFVVTIEQGGSIVPFDADAPVVEPQFTFKSTPLTSL